MLSNLLPCCGYGRSTMLVHFNVSMLLLNVVGRICYVWALDSKCMDNCDWKEGVVTIHACAWIFNVYIFSLYKVLQCSWLKLLNVYLIIFVCIISKLVGTQINFTLLRGSLFGHSCSCRKELFVQLINGQWLCCKLLCCCLFSFFVTLWWLYLLLMNKWTYTVVQ